MSQTSDKFAHIVFNFIVDYQTKDLLDAGLTASIRYECFQYCRKMLPGFPANCLISLLSFVDLISDFLKNGSVKTNI